MKKTLLMTFALLSAVALQAWGWDGSGSIDDPYLIGSSADWESLAAEVDGGNNYAGNVFRLTSDIDARGVMVGAGGTPFSGTFDGDNHTLTFNSGTAGSPVTTPCAPFHTVSGATLRHLNTEGAIYTNAKFAAGIVSRVSGGTSTTITNCHSGITISSAINGDGTHGGLAAVVSENAAELFIENCSFTGRLMNTGKNVTTNCGGFVGWSYVPVTVTNGFFAPANSGIYGYFDRIVSGASFVRMSNENLSAGKARLTGCYATLHMSLDADHPQGTFLFDRVISDADIACEILSEPEIMINGTAYYKSGVIVRLAAPSDKAFDHWKDSYGDCFISDPWRRTGTFQLKDVHDIPNIIVATDPIPGAVTERTLWGVKYRYLSRKDYHYYVSDEDRRAMGWTFRNADDNANLVKLDGSGNESLVTAIVGYDEGGYNSDGVQIHNDLVSNFRDHTHLGVIAPRAFRNSKKLTSLYFKDTDAALYNALLPFQFIIGDAAFEDCTNFKELKMMQYTTKGSNHWEALKPDQAYLVADNAFEGCAGLRVSVHNQQYRDYAASETWRAHRSRLIIYEATTEDFTVEGVRYHYYRKADETGALKNDGEGKAEMMRQILTWNADYQQFNVADLLEAAEDQNVYYCYVIGVDNDKLDSKDGVMRIYNDPGSNYTYKNIALGRNAIAGNTHVKAIEFWQTNGNLENSYSDLKMVIPNGAFKGCKNLRELRLFYYKEDGDDHWEVLGPEDIIPGNNIFGIPTAEEIEQMTNDQLANRYRMPDNFRILVYTERYKDFLDDPNWAPYIGYIEPVDYLSQLDGDNTSFQISAHKGLVYGYMVNPGGIRQASSVVSQDVSWWTVPRHALEAVLTIVSVGSVTVSWYLLGSLAYQSASALAEAIAPFFFGLELADIAIASLQAYDILVKTCMSELANAPTSVSGHKTAVAEAIFSFVNSEYGKQDNFKKLPDNLRLPLLEKGLIDSNGHWMATEGQLTTFLSDDRNQAWLERIFIDVLKYFNTDIANKMSNQEVELATTQRSIRSILSKTTHILAKEKVWASIPYISKLATNSAYFATSSWGGRGHYNTDLMNKGMRENILSNIHQVGLVGGGFVITTPQKNLVYHTYVKEVLDSVTHAVIHAGTDKGQGNNASARTMAFGKNAFRNKKNLQYVSFFENNVSTKEAVPMVLTIPDSAFVGCDNLKEFNLLLQTDGNGTRALGPENFILAGDSIFAGLDSLKFHIVIDPLRKQDFLDNASWNPLKCFFRYEDAKPKAKYSEYGAKYAYAYEQNSIKKVNKLSGHLIEHTIVTGPDDKFITEHQGAVKLCNDIGTYNNYQLDAVMPKAFKGNQNLRSVSFTDLYGFGAYGDVYTGLRMHIGDRAFENCSNLADIAMLYMVTDGLNHIDPITPQMVSIGKNVFDGTNARIKMMPQQVAWFEADSAWAAYKDRFQPCIVKVADEGVKAALKDMAFYDAANTGLDQSRWTDYIDYARIAGKGFGWLDGRFVEQKDKLRSFADFRWLESVGLDYVGASWFDGCSKLSNIVLPSTIRHIDEKAFKGCSSLKEMELPASVTSIRDEAFSGCKNLDAILARGETPATLGRDAFDKHEALKIYVPASRVGTYKSSWSEYAQYIVGDDTYPTGKVVTVTAVGQLARKLGLAVTKEHGKVRYLAGPYAKYDSLTVSGPLNGEDLAVIRHLAGADAYDSDPTDGRLRYLDLWNADIKKDTENSYNGNFDDEYTDQDNKVGDYLFENCAMLETVILPKSATFIGENVFEDARALKRVCVGLCTTGYDTDLLQNLDGIEELAMLTRRYAGNDSYFNDPWEGDIGQVWTLPSQTGSYMGDPKLTRRAHGIAAPLKDEEVMLALAEHGHYFPSDYMQMESAENIFCGNLAITDLGDFEHFMGVKRLASTFVGMDLLETIRLPHGIEAIDSGAFSRCTSLGIIYVACDSVPSLAENAFIDLPTGFQILVPKRLCKLYRSKWAQYADHINPDASFDAPGDEIITVTLTEANTLAEKLGLKQTLTDDRAMYGSWSVTKLTGDYSNIRRLKVKGPISGADLDVLDYLAGYCKWAECRNYSGHLEYLDLYDARLKETDVSTRGYDRHPTTGYLLEQKALYKVPDNTLPHHALLRAYSLKTLILPKTCRKVNERALQECEGLEALVVGDDMEDFNWNALDDDAMLTRMYILAKKKMGFSTENFVWRNLCNNYNPTFDAFYVTPSLYEEYLTDDAYTGSSWQRTNNVSKGMFDDDESFRYFASHAAATPDDLFQVTSIRGWGDGHEGVRDLSYLGYTAVNSLRAADIRPLTKLEKISLPVTIAAIEDGVFSQSPGLRYVDMLMCDSTMVVDGVKHRGLAALGIDSLRTLTYLPQEYGGPGGVNVVVADSAGLRAEAFRLVEGDYCVPYAFTAGRVASERVLARREGQSESKYTVCLPYTLPVPAGAKAYKLADRDGSTLSFLQETGQMEAFTPYLVVVTGGSVNLGCSRTCEIPATTDAVIGTARRQVNVPGYSMRGTMETVGCKKAAELEAYILQVSDNKWHLVKSGENYKNVSIPALRTYLLRNGGVGANTLSMELLDDIDAPDGIDTLRTTDSDGTECYYDLGGRPLPGRPERGMYIHNGRKHVNK